MHGQQNFKKDILSFPKLADRLWGPFSPLFMDTTVSFTGINLVGA
jgi:hypothetical protein